MRTWKGRRIHPVKGFLVLVYDGNVVGIKNKITYKDGNGIKNKKDLLKYRMII